MYSTELTTDLCEWKNAIHRENCIFTFQHSHSFVHHMDANLGEYEMKAFAVVEDKLPLSWNKGDQAVLPPTEFTRSSHKAAEWVKRWGDLFIYFIFYFHGEILLLWASRITLKINLVDKLEDCSNYSNFFDSLLKFFIILPVRFLRASQWTFAFRPLRLIWGTLTAS